MKTFWFKKIGWIYLPVSVAGAIITLCAFIFCTTVFIAVDRHSHSVSDTFYGIFPYVISALTVLFWIAGNTSAKANP
jgi:hypothetical protein